MSRSRDSFKLEIDLLPSIQRIWGISKINNVGLIKLDKAIKFNPGLNVIFGHNGTGKSSLYQALRVALGKTNKVIPNINEDEKKSEVTIEVENKTNGKLETIEWTSGVSLPNRRVMIFDNDIAKFIVENEQVNEFELAHLKMEYFSLLLDLYEQVEREIGERKEFVSVQLNLLVEHFSSTSPQVAVDKLTDSLVIPEFSDSDESLLKECETNLELLNKDTAGSRIRNLVTSIGKIKSLLETLGVATAKGGKTIWGTSFDDAGLTALNKLIKQYKTDTEKINQNNVFLKETLLLGWLSNELWQNFIQAGIDFVRSLPQEASNEFNDSSCVYCHQTLATDKAKELVKKYKALADEYQKNINVQRNDILKYAENLKKLKLTILTQEAFNNELVPDLKFIGVEAPLFDYVKLAAILERLEQSIRASNELSLAEDEKGLLGDFWLYYKNAYMKLEEAVESLRKNLTANGINEKDLRGKIEGLAGKKILAREKCRIEEYLSKKKTCDLLTNYLKDLTAFKRYLGTSKTRFAQLGALLVFQNHLNGYYEYFNFTKPKTWEISCSTDKDLNKRAYRIGDEMLLSEIFSEGERKLHALADFFAQADLGKYSGTYIFDDPVSSLDETNMEKVAEKLKNLVNSGNQVIVFTHSVVFLNLLIDVETESVSEVKKFSFEVQIEQDAKFDKVKRLNISKAQIELRIKKLKELAEHEVAQDDLAIIYGMISRYLEDFVELEYLKNVINRYRPRVSMSRLVELESIDVKKIQEILAIYKITHRKALRHSSPQGAPALKLKDVEDDFRRLLSL